MSLPRWSSLALLLVALTGGCASHDVDDARDARPVRELATSGHRWTGVAASSTGRVFVSWPRWSRELPLSVAELDTATGELRPFPDVAWNAWTPGVAPREAFVCVQAMWVDDEDVLWILDPASPMLAGVVPGGAKLVGFDLADGDRLVEHIVFPESIAPRRSYLNDVRVDTLARHAYITDSGLGALVVVDLDRDVARRLLEGHASTRSQDAVPVIHGERWTTPEGGEPDIHADGLALSPAGTQLFWHALTGTTLWSVPARMLRDPALPESELAAQVVAVAETGPTDGMIFLEDGRLVFGDLERDGIAVWSVRDGVRTVLRDPRLVWPDSFARLPDGDLLVTTSRLNEWGQAHAPFGLYRLRLPAD